MAIKITNRNAYGFNTVSVKVVSVHTAAALFKLRLNAAFLQGFGCKCRRSAAFIQAEGFIKHVRRIINFNAVFFFNHGHCICIFFKQRFKFTGISTAHFTVYFSIIAYNVQRRAACMHRSNICSRVCALPVIRNSQYQSCCCADGVNALFRSFACVGGFAVNFIAVAAFGRSLNGNAADITFGVENIAAFSAEFAEVKMPAA